MRRSLVTKKNSTGAAKIPNSVIEAVVRETLSAKSRDSKPSPTKDGDWAELDDSRTNTSSITDSSRRQNELIQGGFSTMLDNGEEAKEIARLRRALQASSARERVLVRENATLQVAQTRQPHMLPVSKQLPCVFSFA